MSDVDLSVAGGKEARSRLKEFHRLLNHADWVPERAYRRNVAAYPLVCYVNNIVGLFLAKNYEVIPLFIRRAMEHMAAYPPAPVSVPYYELIERYLRHMAYVLRNFSDISEESLALHLPETVLVSGPQAVPEFPPRPRDTSQA